MDFRLRVEGGDEAGERQGARIDGDGGAGGHDDEAIVYVGVGGAESEGVIRGKGGVGDGCR